MKVWRFQKIKLYLFFLYQVKSLCRWNLFFTHQINNFDNFAGQPVFSNNSNASMPIKKRIIPPWNGLWIWLTAYWMQNLEWYTLNCYGHLGNFNGLEISGLITNWRKFTKSLWCLRNVSIQDMHEKFTLADVSYHFPQIFLRTIFIKPRCISNVIKIKTNNKIITKYTKHEHKYFRRILKTFASMRIKYST